MSLEQSFPYECNLTPKNSLRKVFFNNILWGLSDNQTFSKRSVLKILWSRINVLLTCAIILFFKFGKFILLKLSVRNKKNVLQHE